ncbi:glutaredoxin [Thiohalocapsa halophila]|uniref:Glutaredoxin n=1 Tax=Thiohalocapsa halophila TaxID=69359 RepID=A0ABS1CH86_9GAMM|nr:glutathione S-transferase N-terminal domain-containing protein [Thiohalocapsa halophila]MBK1631244.1 glutaredoxin [Thiohalocapsa halophila]
MLLKLVREGLGRTVAFVDRITRPTPIQRTPEAQQQVEQALDGLALYQYFACPFCIKTRRALHRLNLPLELRDAQNDPAHRSTLERQGGRIQVPCLRIDSADGTEWMYESNDIIRYLEHRFGAVAPAEQAG